MSKLLYIEASPRKERSHSIFVSNAFIETFLASNPSNTVETWDVWKEPMPEFDGSTLSAKYRVLDGQTQDTAEQKAWQEVERLANRFKSADAYLISSPMWNYGIPYKLKHFFDVISQPGMTFGYDPAKGYFGLVTGKKAVIICASGGKYGPGSGAEALDFQRPYIEHILRFFGITEQSIITVDGTLYGPEATKASREAGLARAQELAKNF